MLDPFPPILTLLNLQHSVDLSSQHAIVILLCLVSCAFFSGMEIAFLSSNKLKVELKRNSSKYSDKLLHKYIENPSRFISTVLIGNNVALIIYGIFMGEVLFNLLAFFSNTSLAFIYNYLFIRFLTITVLSTIIVLITAEFIPKTLFRLNPNVILSALIIPFRFFEIIFWPLIWLVKTCSHGILNIFTNTPKKENLRIFSKVDLDEYLTILEQQGAVSTNEIDTQIFRNALDLNKVKVIDIMVPRSEITYLDINENIATLKQLFNESQHSKVIITKTDLDNPKGFIHINELFKNPTTLAECLKPVHITTETTAANDLLKELIQKHKSVAIVVNEFGTTSGMLTMEDILEEVFGEIEDEFDVPELTEIKISNTHYVFSGRLDINYLNNKHAINLPEGDYNTLGGFITHKIQRIPIANESIIIDNFTCLITKAKESHIVELELKINL